MAKSKGKDYFGLGRIVSIILAIIPITAWLFGVITRIKEGKIVAGILRIFFGFNIVWLIDYRPCAYDCKRKNYATFKHLRLQKMWTNAVHFFYVNFD